MASRRTMQTPSRGERRLNRPSAVPRRATAAGPHRRGGAGSPRPRNGRRPVLRRTKARTTSHGRTLSAVRLSAAAAPNHAAPCLRSGRRLIERSMGRRSQLWSLHLVAARKSRTILARFEAASDPVPRGGRVPAGVLRGRRIAAADVAARCATAQVEPPAARLQALDAAGAARVSMCRIPLVGHPLS